MFIERGIDYSALLLLAPAVAITANQVKAIIIRDNHKCTFSFPHICHGRLTVHHIDGKEDDPNNVVTVCHDAHWEHLHNKATEDEQLQWKEELSLIAQKKTEGAIKKGWIYPDK